MPDADPIDWYECNAVQVVGRYEALPLGALNSWLDGLLPAAPQVSWLCGRKQVRTIPIAVAVNPGRFAVSKYPRQRARKLEFDRHSRKAESSRLWIRSSAPTSQSAHSRESCPK